MKNIADLSGIFRGIKIIREAYLKEYTKIPCKISDYTLNSESLLSLINNTHNLPDIIKSCITMTMIQGMEVGKYWLKVNRTNKEGIIEVGGSFSRDEYSPNTTNIALWNDIVVKDEFHEDAIDRELITQYRKQHLQKNVEINIVQNTESGNESRVPSSEVGRALNFASLFARLGVGAVAERTRRVFGLQYSGDQSNTFLSEANARRIVDSLCRVRGAALKLGQMLSIQDSEFIHPQIQEIFERVRQHADFMPVSQMYSVMTSELGENWKSLFLEFDDRPFAAASIGQVHRAITSDGSRQVAVKVQYPGVRRSIDSDINNLMSLLRFMKALPAGLHADRAIEVAKKELAYECDYKREAKYATLFADKLKNDPVFIVPRVLPHLSSMQVISTELVQGITLDKCISLSQETRDWVGTQMLRLCLMELFELFTMQTDPNWANFLFNISDEKIYLLDFGASRTFDKVFVDDYLRVIKAASVQDKETILYYSRKLGFLTGFETKVMEQAHIDAVSILGEVFTSKAPFDFSEQSTTKRIKELIPVMLEHRLTPPPEETYSLHRKLSGGFLLCTKLKARVSCSKLFTKMYNKYKFE